MLRIGRLLAISAQLAGLLLCLEAALQVYFRVVEGRWIFRHSPFKVEHIVAQDDRRVFSYKPNFRDPTQRLTIDQYGFRSSATVPVPEEGSKVIAALGDSVPFGHGLSDEETYPFVLGKLLAERRSPLRVVNAGVQSYNLAQSIEHFRRDVRAHYQPLIVTLQAANDVGLLLTYGDAWTPDTTWTPQRRDLLSWALPRSATVTLLGSRWLRFNTGGESAQREWMLQNAERLLEEFAEECAKAGIVAVLLPINLFYYQTRNAEKNPRLSRWAAWTAEGRAGESVFEDFNRVMAGVAQRKGEAAGVYFFDVRAYLDEADREPLYVDFVHHSPEGSRRVAQGLLEFITAKGLL